MVEQTGLARNHLLSRLSPEDLAILQPHLELVALSFREQLEEPGKRVKNVYFPISGIVSVVANAGQDTMIEVGIIGYEGVTGHSVIMGDGQASNAVFVQVPAEGYRMAEADLRAAVAQSATLQSVLLRFIQVFATQASQTALANGQFKLDERLTRWLLMAQDRLRSDELPLTHELLALMLGVRRAGVTQALHVLEGNALIKTRRGSVTVLDRAGLAKIADGIYGAPEAEYRRLIG